MASSHRIEAAGGVLWREESGRPLVAVVHRDRYDDWTLPKGKCKDGESAMHAAVREVAEETGSDVSVSRRLGEVRYQVEGVDKSVWFWAMRHVGGDFAPSDEVDRLEWLDVDAARTRLSHVDERAMLGTLTAAPLPTSVVVVIRHAKAGRRSDWKGPDRQRPLESEGRAQARAIVVQTSLFAPRRVVSADPLRCVQTVRPLAHRLGLPVEIDPAFSDRVSSAEPKAAEAALAALVDAGEAAAVCSQGDTITALLGQTAAKGSAWVLGCRSGDIVSVDYYRAAGRR